MRHASIDAPRPRLARCSPSCGTGSFGSLDVNLPLIKLLKGPSLEGLAAELLAATDHGWRPRTAGPEACGPTGRRRSPWRTWTGVRVLSPWLIRGRGPADAPCRVVCFHSMGVGASLFTAFLLNPPAAATSWRCRRRAARTVQAEPVAESVDQLADQIAPQTGPAVRPAGGGLGAQLRRDRGLGGASAGCASGTAGSRSTSSSPGRSPRT